MRESLASLRVDHLELAVALQSVHLQLVRVECLELLVTFSRDLNHQVLVLDLLRNGDSLGDETVELGFVSVSWNHLDALGVEGHHIAEAFGVVLEEGGAGEEKLGVDDVVLHLDEFDVDGLDGECALGVHGDLRKVGLTLDVLLQIGLLLLLLLALQSGGGIIDLCHLFLVVELAIELVQLILDGQEHHLPRADGVVVVLLHDASGDSVTVFSSGEKVEVRLEVVILNLEGIAVFEDGQAVEQLDSFVDAVLKLQVVHEDHLVIKRQFLLLDETSQELVVGVPEGHIQDRLFVRLANLVSSRVDHGVVLQMLQEAVSGEGFVDCYQGGLEVSA